VKRARSVLAAVLAVLPLAGLPVRPVAASEPPAGAVSRLAATIPNYFFLRGHTPIDWSPSRRSNMTVAVDPVRGRYFQFLQETCSTGFRQNTAVYDLATLRLTRTGCVMDLHPGTVARSGATLRYATRTNAGGRASVIAIDPTDGVFFLAANEIGVGSQLTDAATTQAVPHQVAVFSEQTLELLDVWTLPAGSPPHIGGLSWYAPTNELIVTTDWSGSGSTHPGGAVTVTSYDVPGMLARRTTAPLWSHQVGSCLSNIQSSSAALEAHLSRLRPALYVPCYVGLSGHLDGPANTPSYRSGVVTVPVGAGSGCPTGRRCPTSEPERVAVAPTSFQGFVFDPGSDRAFAPNNTGAAGITLLVYDGATSAFVSRTSIGTATDRNNASLGLDPRTGRLYGAGHQSLTLLDGRRTPLGTGLSDRRFAGSTYGTDLAIVPPSRQHPYTRVVVPYMECGTHDCALPRMTILADRLPVTVNPPLSDRDAGTYNGPLRGDETRTYEADASGYGVHLAWVGSLGSVLNNENGGNNQTGQALAQGDRDVLAGYVRKVSLGEESAAASASPLADGNSSTSQAIGQDPSLPVPPPTSLPSHAWPYPTVACGYPGVVRHDETKDTAATAAVVCDAQAQGPDAQARFGGRAATAQGGPTVSFAAAETTAHVYPPTRTTGVRSTVTSTVTGLTVDLGPDTGRIDIGQLSQSATTVATGRTGGAKATWGAPELRDVSVRTAGGPTVVLCAQLCAHYDAVIEQVNTTFAAYLRIIRPAPDVYGSPGGYEAAVQTGADAANGDVQFNHVSSEQAAVVPGLRLVLYNDGNALSRVVVDLAGARAYAHLGVQRLTDLPPPSPPPTATPSTGPRTDTGRDYAIPVPRGGFSRDGKQTYQPPVVADNPVVRAVLRAFHGFGFLLRRPGELLSVLALLVLLLGPALLMARRRTWTRDVFAD
jgi:hypothetical protein